MFFNGVSQKNRNQKKKKKQTKTVKNHKAGPLISLYWMKVQLKLFCLNIRQLILVTPKECQSSGEIYTISQYLQWTI